ncbi:F0F1 ATP synthase subunit epsilon [Devosia sp. J2-20]|jgi:F-type H+-transporting ATPase subunit epsilon|uniref:ATP synthase epsilon chain n=1 Tax=Devosia litorisediminis TaxID=2829817 RepID=A0A942EFE7_9HYPH|nr:MULTISPECIES: F0F1 ATP synthase subunit epsilon [Devosia]MBS3850234.1 F0F1 ATP synthase subunit epsilon [Devosia litorisediminis]MCZ4347268.1 F0F1 ATP synthase subunit epsilon [Devosia neptuniae]WDQ99991.1 F0F1 ATP synthase subunit epsilon [Devosia sp. J2-20]|tara:strand:+ start:592 stop:1017 length:426 start_codon:yes stop_codon:yes gene_type:complete
MAEGLKIEIVSPERLVLSEVVTSVTVPGSEGYLTVMNDHAPFMTTLRRGFITVNGLNGRDEIFFVKGGFADVSADGLTILAEQSSPIVEFDHAELAEQIKAAEAELATAKTPEEQSYAQEVVSALANLAIEAGQINGGHVH